MDVSVFLMHYGGSIAFTSPVTRLSLSALRLRPCHFGASTCGRKVSKNSSDELIFCQLMKIFIQKPPINSLPALTAIA